MTEQFALGKRVAMRAVAADADADRSRGAALALRLPNRMKNALANTFESAVGAAKMFERAGQGILRVLVLAATALQQQLHFDLVVSPTARSG